jgi:hypothetical protein
MQPALLEALASQRAAQLPMAAVNSHRQPVLSSQPARMIRRRIGWALVHLGLRLIVEQQRS